MINSEQLFNTAMTLFINEKNPSIIQHLIEIAYRVRELESREITAPKASPNSEDFMMKKYTDLMNEMAGKDPMKLYIDSIKDTVSTIVGPALNEAYQEYRNQLLDPAAKAETILEDDSKKWAREYLTAPTDTSMDKAEELRRQAEERKLREEWARNKPPEIPIDKMHGTGAEFRELLKKAKAGYEMENGKWKKTKKQ